MLCCTYSYKVYKMYIRTFCNLTKITSLVAWWQPPASIISSTLYTWVSWAVTAPLLLTCFIRISIIFYARRHCLRRSLSSFGLYLLFLSAFRRVPNTHPTHRHNQTSDGKTKGKTRDCRIPRILHYPQRRDNPKRSQSFCMVPIRTYILYFIFYIYYFLFIITFRMGSIYRIVISPRPHTVIKIKLLLAFFPQHIIPLSSIPNWCRVFRKGNQHKVERWQQRCQLQVRLQLGSQFSFRSPYPQPLSTLSRDLAAHWVAVTNELSAKSTTATRCWCLEDN